MKNVNRGYKQEKRLMKKMGLIPVPYSGSRFNARQDGECSHFIAQSKATGKASITLKLEDITNLLSDAAIAHKFPLFTLEFIQPITDGGSQEFVMVPIDRIDRFVTLWQEHSASCKGDSGSD